jgi:hypothetical protein
VPLLLLLTWAVQSVSTRSQSVPPSSVAPASVDSARIASHPVKAPASAPAARPLATGQLRSQRVLSYGRADGQLGMVHEKEQPPIGPESFTVSRDGNILVADVVNQRIVVYSSDGAYLRSIELPGIALGDVTGDSRGRIFAYDQVRRSMLQFSADGSPRGSLDLNPKDINTRGYFHVAGNTLYFADAAARDVLVATIQEDGLVPPDKSAERTTDGIHAESGRVYSLTLDKGQGVRIAVRDTGTSSASQALEVAVPGVVSVCYAGEDLDRRFYVQTERMDGTRVILEVLGFDSNGRQLSTTRLPENDYLIWTAKLVDVRGDGTIVQFLPQRTQARLNLFAN